MTTNTTGITPSNAEIEEAFRQFVRDGSGLPDEDVIYGNTDHRYVPHGVYADILMLPSVLMGVPERLNRWEEDDGLHQTVYLPRRSVCTVQFIVHTVSDYEIQGATVTLPTSAISMDIDIGNSTPQNISIASLESTDGDGIADEIEAEIRDAGEIDAVVSFSGGETSGKFKVERLSQAYNIRNASTVFGSATVVAARADYDPCDYANRLIAWAAGESIHAEEYPFVYQRPGDVTVIDGFNEVENFERRAMVDITIDYYQYLDESVNYYHMISKLGPTPNTFDDIDARDTQAESDSSWLSTYDDDDTLGILVGTQRYARFRDQWIKADIVRADAVDIDIEN